MKKKVFLIFYFVAFFYGTNIYSTSAITYGYKGGRFGDNLLTYIKAKWIAYKYGLDFYYKPFKYSDTLRLHDIEKKFDRELLKGKFNRLIGLHQKKEEEIDFNAQDIFYESSLLFSPKDWDNTSDRFTIPDCDFIQMIRSLIVPKQPIDNIRIPDGYISVAVHVRKGSGYDLTDPTVIPGFITKFIPDSFFIDQIDRLGARFFNKQLYVFIFTDYKDPQSIVEQYERQLSSPNITLDCRACNDNCENVILDDFFNMACFDCLIRPAESSFSMVAQLLGDHKIVIYPCKVHKEHDEVIVDEVAEIVDGVNALL